MDLKIKLVEKIPNLENNKTTSRLLDAQLYIMMNIFIKCTQNRLK